MPKCAKCDEWHHKMFKNSLTCFYEWKCRAEIYEMLEHNINIEKNNDFVFFQSKLVWENDKDASCIS